MVTLQKMVVKKKLADPNSTSTWLFFNCPLLSARIMSSGVIKMLIVYQTKVTQLQFLVPIETIMWWLNTIKVKLARPVSN